MVGKIQAALLQEPGLNTTELISKLRLSRGDGASQLRQLLNDGAGRLWRLIQHNERARYWFPMSVSQGDAETVVAARRAEKKQ